MHSTFIIIVAVAVTVMILGTNSSVHATSLIGNYSDGYEAGKMKEKEDKRR